MVIWLVAVVGVGGGGEAEGWLSTRKESGQRQWQNIDCPCGDRTHDLATTTEEDSECISAQMVRETQLENGIRKTNVNIVPITQW